MRLPVRRRPRDVAMADPARAAGPPPLPGRSAPPPVAHLRETGDAYLLDVELPGIGRGDCVEVARGGLVVTGQRQEVRRVGLLRRKARVRSSFRYQVLLPVEVHDQRMETRLEDGVLHVRVPKGQGQARLRLGTT
jgi:HSP20 family protein